MNSVPSMKARGEAYEARVMLFGKNLAADRPIKGRWIDAIPGEELCHRLYSDRRHSILILGPATTEKPNAG